MKFLVFLGTVRDSAPPNPPRLGLRVAKACVSYFQGNPSAELIDPLDFDAESVFKPHFAYSRAKAPSRLQSLAEKIAAADGSFLENVNAERWTDYFGRTFTQLKWWASAVKNHRQEIDPHALIRSFKKDPSQRNTPRGST